MKTDKTMAYNMLRPQKLGEMYPTTNDLPKIKQLLVNGKFPHASLYQGPTGTGKTTTASIVGKILNCMSTQTRPCGACKACVNPDTYMIVVNAANERGIDATRELIVRMSSPPIEATNLIVIMDEAHMLTKEAQTSLLQAVEFSPDHLYIMFCTTVPNSLLPTIRNRCSKFQFNLLTLSQGVELAGNVVKKIEELGIATKHKNFETINISNVIGNTDMSARAITEVMYEAYVTGEVPEIEKEATASALKLIRLIYKEKSKWNEISAAYKELDTTVESFRAYLLNYSGRVLGTEVNNPTEIRTHILAADIIDTMRKGVLPVSVKADVLARIFSIIMKRNHLTTQK